MKTKKKLQRELKLLKVQQQLFKYLANDTLRIIEGNITATSANAGIVQIGKKFYLRILRKIVINQQLLTALTVKAEAVKDKPINMDELQKAASVPHYQDIRIG